MQQFIQPNWPAPATVKAYTTTRQGGVSGAPFNNFNLGDHVGDDDNAVAQNRLLLRNTLQLLAEPKWLKQIHSTQVILAEQITADTQADAAYTRQAKVVCAILTADCLPMLICDRAGTIVAAVHAGWRGLASGIIEQTIQTLQTPPADLLIWLGPAIGADVYEVGAEVRAQFITADPLAEQAFKANANQRWLANMYLLATLRLKHCGVTAIYGGDYCTYSDPERFFSYRRDGQTGRIASLIWLD